MRGLHVHVGSQILDVEPFAESVAPVAALGAFEIYDLGGGLGARYTYADEPPSVAAYLDALIGAAREHAARATPRSSSSPVAAWSAPAATTLYRVVSGQAGESFVAVDGGMGDNLEVALFDQRFEAGDRGPARGGGGVDGRRPPLRERRRAGRRRARSTRPRVGDLLAVPATGAYCHTMANNYNGTRRPPVVFAGDGEARVVVRRETWEDLLAPRRGVTSCARELTAELLVGRAEVALDGLLGQEQRLGDLAVGPARRRRAGRRAAARR